MIAVGGAHVPGSVAMVGNESAPARRLSEIEVLVGQRALVVSLAGDGRLQPSAIHEAEHWPPRIVVELREVTAWVPSVTSIGVGPVADIRVSAQSLDPLVTRVVFQLTRRSDYEIDESKGSNGPLRFIFPLRPESPEQSRHQGRPSNKRFHRLPEDVPSAAAHALLARVVAYPQGNARDETLVPSASPSARLAAALDRLVLGRAPPLMFVLPPRRSIESVGLAMAPEPLLSHPLEGWLAGLPDGSARTVERQARRRSVIQSGARPGMVTTRLQQITQGTPREYSGDPVSMDFQGADLRAVLRTFAEISGLNVVIDPKVDGTVDVALTDVPWDQALDVILRTNQLGYIVDGTIVRIAPLGVLANEEVQRRELAEEQALAGELVVMTQL